MARLNSAAHLEKLRQQILDRDDGKRVVSVTTVPMAERATVRLSSRLLSMK